MTRDNRIFPCTIRCEYRFRPHKYRNGGQLWAEDVISQLHYTRSGRLLAIELPPCPFHLFPLLLWRFSRSQLFCVHYILRSVTWSPSLWATRSIQRHRAVSLMATQSLTKPARVWAYVRTEGRSQAVCRSADLDPYWQQTASLHTYRENKLPTGISLGKLHSCDTQVIWFCAYIKRTVCQKQPTLKLQQGYSL
jgi:hypothetical protein